MIPWGDWLAGVWYPRETDSPGYHTPGSQIFGLKIRITQWILNQNRKYFNPVVSGTGRFELWKKTEGRKSGWTVPLKVNIFLTLFIYRVQVDLDCVGRGSGLLARWRRAPPPKKRRPPSKRRPGTFFNIFSRVGQLLSIFKTKTSKDFIFFFTAIAGKQPCWT